MNEKLKQVWILSKPTENPMKNSRSEDERTEDHWGPRTESEDIVQSAYKDFSNEKV